MRKNEILVALFMCIAEYEVVDGCSMTLYRVATLLEHEMLIGNLTYLSLD